MSLKIYRNKDRNKNKDKDKDKDNKITFKKFLKKEYKKLSTKPEINSLHHYYGLILEELDELWDQIKLKPSKRDYANIIQESAQICALLKRMSKNLEILT